MMSLPSRSRSLREPQKKVESIPVRTSILYTGSFKSADIVPLLQKAGQTHHRSSATASAIPERAKTKSLLPQRRPSGLGNGDGNSTSRPNTRPPSTHQQSPSKGSTTPSMSEASLRKPSIPPPRSDRSTPSIRRPSTAAISSMKTSTTPRHSSRQIVHAQASKISGKEAPPNNKPINKPKPSASTLRAGNDHQQSNTTNSLIPSSWPEIAALQTELLQLHLFHSSMLHRNIEWQNNAEKNLHQKYNDLVHAYKSALAVEKEAQRCWNYQALAAWMDSSARQGFSQQIQALSNVIQDVSDIRTSSRYANVTSTFEDWIQMTENIRKDRDDHSMTKGSTIAFIDPLDPSWKEDVSLLTSKLELCNRRLQTLDIMQSRQTHDMLVNHHASSALVRILLGLGEMMVLMVEDLNAMRLLEREIMSSEKSWMRSRSDQLLAVSSHRDLREHRVGVWMRND